MLVQHYFRYSKFKHSREGFDRFFLPLFLFDLVALSAFSGTDFTSFEAFSDTFHNGQTRSPLSLRIVARDFVLVSFRPSSDAVPLMCRTKYIFASRSY